MTETVWQTCQEPEVMLDALEGKSSRRKLHLFACRGCWAVDMILAGS